MMLNHSLKSAMLMLAAFITTYQANSKEMAISETNEIPTVKELYVPENIRVESGDLKSDTGEYSFQRMKQTENLAIFWSKKFGKDPMANPDTLLRFDVDYILKEGERIYQYYVNDLKFVEKGNSISDKYKCLIFIVNSKDGTAYGGGDDNKVGCFWAPPSRMRKAPFGALAHEMCHSFQYMAGIDKAARKTEDSNSRGGGGGFGLIEMTAQYFLWQVYPNWIVFENYHLVDFMKQTHLAFMHGKNMYHSPFVLEYWSNKHGIEMISRIYRDGQGGVDAVMTYKRLNSIGQEEFNAEMFDACRRFITWDMKRIEQVSAKYANQHFTKLDSIADGWYKISVDKCPQNYGYNGIKLLVPASKKTIKLSFKGIAGAEGYNAVNVEKAGWRYGLVAVKADGSRVYGEMKSEANGETEFKVPNDTKFLWLVVMGAPTDHFSSGRGKEEQWPYQFKLTGTSIDQTANK